MNINAILISTTNPAFQCYVEDEGEVIYTDDGFAYFVTLETQNRFAFRTSLIQRYEYENDEIALHTLNSIYKFKIIGEMKQPCVVTLGACQKRIFEYLDSIKANVFSCISISGFIGFVAFKEKLTRKEAKEEISQTAYFDNNGALVTNIQNPFPAEDTIFGLKIEEYDNQSFVNVSEFENTGLVECLATFMMGRKVCEFHEEEYLKLQDVLKFFGS